MTSVSHVCGGARGGGGGAGADATIDVQNENPRERIQELTGGRGADVVVDVSSYATEPIVQALDFARMGGTSPTHTRFNVSRYAPEPGCTRSVLGQKRGG